MATHNVINSANVIPCFSAYVGATQANVSGNGTSYNVIFDSVLFNDGSYNTATGEFWPPTAGFYFFSTNISFLNSVTGGYYGYYEIYPVGVAIYRNNIVTTRRVANFAGESGLTMWNLAHTIYCGAGSGWKVYVNCITVNGAKTDSIQGKDATNIYYSSFCGYKII